MERPLPYSVTFETVYEPGEVVAISYKDGKEISRDTLVTAKTASKINLLPDKKKMCADGHDLIYVEIQITDENGIIVPDAKIELRALVTGDGYLAGFGSSNPVTEENYTGDSASTYRGRAMAVIRSGYEKGSCELTISADGLQTVKEAFVIA